MTTCPAPGHPARPGAPCPVRPGSLARLLAALVVGLAATFVTAPVALAHGGEGSLALVSFTPADPSEPTGTSWDISVELTYAEDGHVPDDATVTVSGDSSAGEVMTPATLRPDGSGLYVGSFTVPSAGSWNLRVVSVDPPAQLALEPVTMTGEGAGAGSGSEPGTDSSDTVPEDTVVDDGAEVPATETTEVPEVSTQTDEAGSPEDSTDSTADVAADEAAALGEEDSGGSPIAWIVAGAIVLALAAGAAAVFRRRDSGSGGDADGGSGDDTGSGASLTPPSGT